VRIQLRTQNIQFRFFDKQIQLGLVQVLCLQFLAIDNEVVDEQGHSIVKDPGSQSGNEGIIQEGKVCLMIDQDELQHKVTKVEPAGNNDDPNDEVCDHDPNG